MFEVIGGFIPLPLETPRRLQRNPSEGRCSEDVKIALGYFVLDEERKKVGYPKECWLVRVIYGLGLHLLIDVIAGGSVVSVSPHSLAEEGDSRVVRVWTEPCVTLAV
jgi:hypothetical protein